MTTAGNVKLFGDTGEIMFRGYVVENGEATSDLNSDKNPNFRVDSNGNVYCKSLTVENGFSVGESATVAPAGG